MEPCSNKELGFGKKTFRNTSWLPRKYHISTYHHSLSCTTVAALEACHWCLKMIKTSTVTRLTLFSILIMISYDSCFFFCLPKPSRCILPPAVSNCALTQQCSCMEVEPKGQLKVFFKSQVLACCWDSWDKYSIRVKWAECTSGQPTLANSLIKWCKSSVVGSHTRYTKVVNTRQLILLQKDPRVRTLHCSAT